MTERLRDTPLGGKLTGLLKSPGENGWGQAWGTSYTDSLFEASVLGSSLATEDHSYSICKQFQCAVQTYDVGVVGTGEGGGLKPCIRSLAIYLGWQVTLL